MAPTIVELLVSPKCYVTGASALSLPSDTGFPALWYSHALANPESWQLAGVHINGAIEILGLEGIWDASEQLSPHLQQTCTVMAASHERAVFDLLFHFSHLRTCEIPNFRFSDIDDVVEKGLILRWIESNERGFDPLGVQLMKRWLDS